MVLAGFVIAQEISETALAEAILTAANALLAGLDGPPKAFDLDELAKLPTKPDWYVEVTLTRRFGGLYRVGDSRTETVGYRIGTRVVGQWLYDCRSLRTAVAAWEGVTIPIGTTGFSTTPIAFETADDIAPDDGMWSGLTDWTFSI